jgi:uncharacterized protein YdcH (DUF465 family)|tara:strand:+ start:2209 stop:3039 length:831 start_codon:yes stop_codon:yes gene_type:complete
MKNYKNIVSDLEEKINELKKQDYHIGPLDDLLDQLNTHVEEISEVEDHIGAIRSMVISPIKKELEENKKAGNFSIMGFYVGAFGLIASIGSLLYTTFSPSPELIIRDEKTTSEIVQINQKLSEVKRELYLRSGKLTLDENTVKVGQFKEYTVVKGDDVEIKIEPYSFTVYSSEKPNSEVIVSELRIYYDGRRVNHSAIPEILRLTNVENLTRKDKGEFPVAKGDVIEILGKHQIKIVDILNKDARHNSLADTENAIIIKRIETSNKKMQPTQKTRG